MSTSSSESFDVQQYLQSRRNARSFHLVEFGHDIFPIAYSQGFSFIGDKSYTGIEGWLYDTEGTRELYVYERNRIQGAGQNIRFLRQELGRYGFMDGFPADELYEGVYDSATSLEEASATEVVASNVLTDPLVADEPERTFSVLSEMERIVHPGGLIILRETITPRYGDCVADGTVAKAGLEVVAKLMAAGIDQSEWRSLERVYEGELTGKTQPDEASHYTILKRRS